jgi:hypothetical protein
MYLDILNDNIAGFAKITSRLMIDPLFLTYGNITAVDLEHNFKQIRKAWDPHKSVETLFKQVWDCADFSVAGGFLIGHMQQINVGYANIFSTGNFMRACPRWSQKDTKDKTWADFRVKFATARRQHKQMQGGSAANSGYHAANSYVGQNEYRMTESTTGALANLATDTATDRGMVATLTEANSLLAKKLEHHSNKLKDIKELFRQGISERKWKRTLNPSPDNYFSTHGCKLANRHTFLSCNYPKDSQKHEATKAENMGGSQANREWCAGATSLNKREMFENFHTPPLLEHHETEIVDSACKGHFFSQCTLPAQRQNPLWVLLPNGNTMDSTHTASLEIPELSKAESIAHVFPGMANTYLLSVGKLCNEGYYVTFRIDSVTI